MKYIISLCLTIIAVNFATAQIEKAVVMESSKAAAYDVVLTFNSICCGPPSGDFLHPFVDGFNKKNKVHLDAWQWGGCGREGENKVLFSLGNLNKKNAKRFIDSVKKLITQQNTANKSVNESSGEISIAYGILTNGITDCRGQLTSFYPSKKTKLH